MVSISADFTYWELSTFCAAGAPGDCRRLNRAALGYISLFAGSNCFGSSFGMIRVSTFQNSHQRSSSAVNAVLESCSWVSGSVPAAALRFFAVTSVQIFKDSWKKTASSCRGG